MQDEFPDLKYHNYQDEFLSDWWSRKKLFIGKRQSGKSTLINSELRRFLNRDMNCLVLTSTAEQAKNLEERYQKRFGQIPYSDFESYHKLREGGVRGMRYDVVLLDEAQELDFETFVQEIEPMDPMFVRFCACQSKMTNIHYLAKQEDGDYFDSVYHV